MYLSTKKKIDTLKQTARALQIASFVLSEIEQHDKYKHVNIEKVVQILSTEVKGIDLKSIDEIRKVRNYINHRTNLDKERIRNVIAFAIDATDNVNSSLITGILEFVNNLPEPSKSKVLAIMGDFGYSAFDYKIGYVDEILEVIPQRLREKASRKMYPVCENISTTSVVG